MDALTTDPALIVSIVIKAASLGFALLAAGTVLVNSLWLDDDSMIASGSPRTAISASVVAVAAVAVAWVDTARRLYGDTGSAFDPLIIESALATPPGQSYALAMVGLVWILITTLGARTLPLIALPGAVAVLLSLGLVGHTLEEPRWVLYGLLTTHLTLAAIWMGVLLPLSRLTRQPRNRGHAADLAEDFGRWALVLVPALLIVAAALAWQLLGRPTAPPEHDYALILRVKVGLVFGLLVIGACNKFLIVPKLHDSLTAGAWLRFTIVIEALIFTAIVCAVSAMTMLYHPIPV